MSLIISIPASCKTTYSNRTGKDIGICPVKLLETHSFWKSLETSWTACSTPATSPLPPRPSPSIYFGEVRLPRLGQSVNEHLYFGGFMCGVCFVIICATSHLLLGASRKLCFVIVAFPWHIYFECSARNQYLFRKYVIESSWYIMALPLPLDLSQQQTFTSPILGCLYCIYRTNTLCLFLWKGISINQLKLIIVHLNMCCTSSHQKRFT